MAPSMTANERGRLMTKTYRILMIAAIFAVAAALEVKAQYDVIAPTVGIDASTSVSASYGHARCG